MTDTFKKRGPQSEHLGGLCGYGLGDGTDKKDPSGDNTYISSGTILSFWTPIHSTKRANIDLVWSIHKN